MSAAGVVLVSLGFLLWLSSILGQGIAGLVGLCRRRRGRGRDIY